MCFIAGNVYGQIGGGGLGGLNLPRRNANTPSDTTKKNQKSSKTDSINYDFKTTTFLYETTLRFFGDSGRTLDTTLGFMHRYNRIQRLDYRYQNLGNIGTPLHAIFHQTPDQIGTRWGATAYDQYRLAPEAVRYFNTQSPFTNLHLIQGGQGKTDLITEFARNVNPEWNVGLLYYRRAANRVVGNNFRRNDVMLTHQTFGVSTRYYTPNRRYKLLAHFIYYQFDNLESGGLRAQRIRQSMDSLFLVPNAELTERLTRAQHREDGRRLHLYQEYAVARDHLSVFYTFTRANYASRLRDDNYQSNRTFYPRNYFDSTNAQQTRYSATFDLTDHTAGIKVRVNKYQLRTYARYRSYGFRTRSLQDSSIQDTSIRRDLPDELFVGGYIQLPLDSQGHQISGQAEYLIGGGYRLTGTWQHPSWTAEISSSSYAPDLWAQDRRFGNHYRWDNRDFRNVLAQEVQLTYHYRSLRDSSWGFEVHPFARIRQYDRFVFYDQEGIARQDTAQIRLIHGGWKGKVYYKYWNAELDVMYSQNLEQEIIRIPQFFTTLTMYYERKLFKGIMPSRIGVELHWHSAFQGNSFNPATQQFQLQDQHQIGNYIYADAFWNFRVNRVFLFLKINNLLQGLSAQNYFETPFYMAQPRSFEFGFQWRFFD